MDEIERSFPKWSIDSSSWIPTARVFAGIVVGLAAYVVHAFSVVSVMLTIDMDTAHYMFVGIVSFGILMIVELLSEIVQWYITLPQNGAVLRRFRDGCKIGVIASCLLIKWTFKMIILVCICFPLAQIIDTLWQKEQGVGEAEEVAEAEEVEGGTEGTGETEGCYRRRYFRQVTIAACLYVVGILITLDVMYMSLLKRARTQPQPQLPSASAELAEEGAYIIVGPGIIEWARNDSRTRARASTSVRANASTEVDGEVDVA